MPDDRSSSRQGGQLYTDFNRYHELCAPFINEGYITEFCRVVKKGKEATVLCCKAAATLGVDFLALKLYKDEEFRNFRNDAGYIKGKVWDKRLLKRLKVVKHEIWVETEYNILVSLFDAGVRVPKPCVKINQGILMEFIGIEEEPAPLLKNAHLEREEAFRVFDQIISSLKVMLSCGVVHGDLSAFNILYNGREAIIIDFPQSIFISTHDEPFTLFERDVENICGHFVKYGCEIPEDFAVDLWSQYYR